MRFGFQTYLCVEWKRMEIGLFSPDEAKGLEENYGEGFEKLYEKYEQEGKHKGEGSGSMV